MADPNFSNVTTLLHFNANFSDYSNNGIPVWTNGGVTLSSAQSKFGGYSALFNGTNGYLTLPQNTAFEFGTNDFTVECWVYSLSSTQAGTCFISDNYSGYGNPITTALGLFDFSTGGGNTLAFGYYNGTGGWYGVVSSTTLPTNTWTHIAGVRTGGVATLFKDGVAIGWSTNFGPYIGQPDFLHIGRRWDTYSSTSYWNGYIDEVRITNGIARYGTIPLQTSAFPDNSTGDPNFANVSVLLHGDSLPITESSNNTYLSITGGATVSATQSKFGGKSLYFPNTAQSSNGCVSGTTSGVAFGSGDFTIECWIYPTVVWSYAAIFSTRPDNGGYADAINLTFDGNGMLYVYSNSVDVNSSNGTIVANQWQHIAVCRSGNTLKLYYNGRLVGVNTNYTKTPTRTFYGVGQHPVGASEAYQGYIDELRVTKGICRYDQTFTPSTIPFDDLGSVFAKNGAFVPEINNFTRYCLSNVMQRSDGTPDSKFTRAYPFPSFGVKNENSTPSVSVRNPALAVSNGREFKYNSVFRNDDQPIWKNPAFIKEQNQINVLPVYRKPFKLIEPR